jgi:hypothetical protein
MTESMTVSLRVLLNGTLSSHSWATLLDTHVEAVASVHGSLCESVNTTLHSERAGTRTTSPHAQGQPKLPGAEEGRTWSGWRYLGAATLLYE